ncbi:hypothetical protein AgCh_034411 [Apium graveolens]
MSRYDLSGVDKGMIQLKDSFVALHKQVQNHITNSNNTRLKLDQMQTARYTPSPLVMDEIQKFVQATFGSSTAISTSSSHQPASTSTHLQIQSLQGQVTALQNSNSSLTAQVQALTSLVKSQQIDIQTLVDSHKHLQMQNSVVLGAIMGKLNIPLPSLPEQVRPEIPTPLLIPVNKTKGEIEVRLTRSRSSQQQVQGAEKKSKEVDLDMERLIRAAEGPSLSREFDELLTALKASLNDNQFTYKKALDKTINFIRMIMVNQDNFLHKRIVINTNDSRTDRCMQVSLNYLVSRRASELDIFISKVKFITHEDTLLLTELRNAQMAAFPEAYLHPSKGITYICPNTNYFKHFQIPKHYVMSNKKLIMILGTGLRAKKNKNNDDMEMIKLPRRYLDNAEANLPKTQINKDNLDDDEQKKDDQNPSGSNPSQSSKPSGSKRGEKKKRDDKKDEERRRRGERKIRKPHDDSENSENPKNPNTTNSNLSSTHNVNYLKHQTTSNLKVKVSVQTNSQLSSKNPNHHKPENFKKMTNLPLAKPSLKFKHKSVGRKPKKVKPAKKVEVTERAIWNCFKQSDFLPLNWEVRIFYEDGSFTFLSSKLMDSLSTTEIKRIISLVNDKDTASRAWRSVLAEWLIEREEIKKRDEAEAEERMK